MIIQSRPVHRQRFNVRGDVRGVSGVEDDLAVVTAQATPAVFSSGDLIAVSVTSGLIVWAVTRFLNKVFGGSR